MLMSFPKEDGPSGSLLRPAIFGRAIFGHARLGAAIVVFAAVVATVPILLHGPLCGDDLEFHLISWLDVQQCWRHGIIYPHWAPSPNFGAGEPRFLFYPPLTWMLGAALGLVLPWRLAPAAMVFLFLAGTGFAVRALAREALGDWAATVAGCAALGSGFALFTAYERTAYAELTGGFWIPLLLLFALRDRNAAAPLMRRAFDGSTVPLALIVAGCWLSDGPVGVMGCYLVVAVAVAASLGSRSPAYLLRATIAAALGIALAGFYLLPAAWEQKSVDLHAAIELPVFQVQNNFLFARHPGPLWIPFDAVLHRASMLAMWMIGVALLSPVWLWGRSVITARSAADGARAARSKVARLWWVCLALIPCAVLALQFSFSAPVWSLLPKLKFLQYPWRWVLVVETPMAVFLAAAICPSPASAVWKRRTIAAVCAVLFAGSVGFAARDFLRLCHAKDTVRYLVSLYQSGGGVEGTDEYEAPSTDHWKIAQGLPDACFVQDSNAVLGVSSAGQPGPVWQPQEGSCTARAMGNRQPEHLKIHMVAPQSGYVILRLLSFPAWRVTVNGHGAAIADSRDDGLIAVAVPQGAIDVSADWTTSPDVLAGCVVSALALLALIGLRLLEARLAMAGKAGS
jgi:hypothetical protein